MSRRAIVRAVRDTLRATPPGGLGYTYKECELSQPGGQPPPRAGKWFLAVWAGGSRNHAGNRYVLDREYDVVVTVTMRVNEPFDRIYELLDKPTTGFYDRVDAVIRLIHKDNYNFNVSNRANTIIGDPGNSDEPVGFRVPLAFLDESAPRFVGSDWFHADPNKPELGVATDIKFGRARRLENLANVGV